MKTTDHERRGQELAARGDFGLTAIEFLQAGGGMKLNSRVSELRARGFIIRGETEKNNRGGKHMRYYASYAEANRIIASCKKGGTQ